VKSKDFPQLTAMRAGVDYRFKIACRHWEGFVRPLTSFEIIEAASKTAESWEKLKESQRMSISASLLNAMFQLEMASTLDVGEPAQLPHSLLQMMTPDEVNHLWKQYVRMCDVVNPSFEEMSKEKLDELVLGLKKSSEKLSILTELSISTLIGVCLRLLSESEG
jgi:hypothetical protein